MWKNLKNHSKQVFFSKTKIFTERFVSCFSELLPIAYILTDQSVRHLKNIINDLGLEFSNS